MLSAETLERARVLVPATPGVKRLQSIIYTQLQRAMLGQISSDQAVREAEDAVEPLRALTLALTGLD